MAERVVRLLEVWLNQVIYGTSALKPSDVRDQCGLEFVKT